jgi:hypothetical protein
VDLLAPLGERTAHLIARAQPQTLDEQHHRRERDPEVHERDVDAERERLKLPPPNSRSGLVIAAAVGS